MRIKKIKYDGCQVFIEYHELKANEGWEEFTLKSFDRPTQEFKDGLKDLAKYFELICELPEGYSSTITVKGVSFSYGGPDETMGAVLIGSKDLEKSNAPLNLNTPHLLSADYNGNDNDKLLPFGCVKALEYMMDLAIGFVEGERDLSGTTEKMF